MISGAAKRPTCSDGVGTCVGVSTVAAAGLADLAYVPAITSTRDSGVAAAAGGACTAGGGDGACSVTGAATGARTVAVGCDPASRGGDGAASAFSGRSELMMRNGWPAVAGSSVTTSGFTASGLALSDLGLSDLARWGGCFSTIGAPATSVPAVPATALDPGARDATSGIGVAAPAALLR